MSNASLKTISLASALLVLQIMPTPAHANTGNEILPKCQLAARASVPAPDEIIGATYCLGIISTLVAVGPFLEPPFRFCFPKEGTNQQAIRVVVSNLEKNPATLHQDFRLLAVMALRDAFPCNQR
ncbi:Rap1a/Tai family immunity protein [Reyranella sp.]|jgi:hypothetical protein|uniref:Rap1a/Tai family immunity protein n=1 Tax=Reyranella sp. TaxID=1929291 RepID=UPI0026127D4B|nr:Rap1a/Tai family immunity protein [Reyranella sp.]HQS14407.1 Rap1a/Tai family immunity protein [Reyranella sp.]HQT11404.1 Rap1a/Tai family immunity protein [Reyranella sp.]